MEFSIRGGEHYWARPTRRFLAPRGGLGGFDRDGVRFTLISRAIPSRDIPRLA